MLDPFTTPWDSDEPLQFIHAHDDAFSDSLDVLIPDLLARAHSASPWIVERLNSEFSAGAVCWRVKSAERVAEKVEDRRSILDDYSPAQMNDLLGARVIVPSWSTAAEAITRAVAALAATECRVANSLKVPQRPTGYRAITATIRAGNGYVFQLEVMTEEAESIIEHSAHPAYRRRRSLDLEIARTRAGGSEPSEAVFKEYEAAFHEELVCYQQIAHQILTEIDKLAGGKPQTAESEG